jgi:hypothetical protein
MIANTATRQSKDIRKGDDVLLLDGHWKGHIGKYVTDRKQGFKKRRVVQLTNGDEAFVTRDDQWKRVSEAA